MISKRDLLAGTSALLAAIALPAAAEDKKKYIVQIPISFDPAKHPVVDLFIGQAGPYRFVIDTGSYSAMIKEDLAKSLKLGTNGVASGVSLAGKVDREYIYAATDVLMGGIFKIPHLDLVGAAKLPLPGVDGVLPASILTALPTELDYAAAMVRYYLGGAPLDLDGFSKLDTVYQADSDGGAEKVYVNLKIDGHKALCLVDTGAAGRLFLSGAYVSTHGLWNKYTDAGDSGAVGANGEGVKTRVVKIPDVDLGPVKFDEVWVQLGDPGGLDTLLDQGIDGIIGDDILSQFTLAFAEHKELFLKPNKSFSPAAGARPAVHHALNAAQPIVPFLYRDDRKIVVPGGVKGKPAVGCLINTGVVRSGIAPATAQALGLAQTADGFDGMLLSGGWSPPHLDLVSRDVLAKQPNPVDLGLDFLTAMPCRIDFDLNEITIFAEGAPDMTGYSLFTERKANSDPRFYVTVKLAGDDLVCLFDTNSQATLTLPPHTVKARGLWDKFPDAEKRKSGPVEMRLAKVAGLDVAGLHRDDTPVLLIDPASTVGDVDTEAMLGMGFLHRCNWIFTPDGKLYAKTNSFWARV